MPANDLRDLIAFEQRTLISDGYGNEQGDTWDEEFQRPARVQMIKGGEEVMAARLGGRQPVVITVREDANTLEITTDWRARDVRKGTLYNIRSVADPQQHTANHDRWIDILAEAGVAI